MIFCPYCHKPLGPNDQDPEQGSFDGTIIRGNCSNCETIFEIGYDVNHKETYSCFLLKDGKEIIK